MKTPTAYDRVHALERRAALRAMAFRLAIGAAVLWLFVATFWAGIQVASIR